MGVAALFETAHSCALMSLAWVLLFVVISLIKFPADYLVAISVVVTRMVLAELIVVGIKVFISSLWWSHVFWMAIR